MSAAMMYEDESTRAAWGRYEDAEGELTARLEKYRAYGKLNKTSERLWKRVDAARHLAHRAHSAHLIVKYGITEIGEYTPSQLVERAKAECARRATAEQPKKVLASGKPLSHVDQLLSECPAQYVPSAVEVSSAFKAQEAQEAQEEDQKDQEAWSIVETEKLIYALARLVSDGMMQKGMILTVQMPDNRTAKYSIERVNGGIWYLNAALPAGPYHLDVSLYANPCGDRPSDELLAAIRYLINRVQTDDFDDMPF